ncbi:PIN domain-containing protein [soil metagenome]
MILLDAGYLIALMHSGDSLHQRARKWVLAFREPLVVTEFVICEAVDAFSMPMDRPKAHALVTRLRTDPNIEIIPASADLFENGLQFHAKRSDKAWSLTDCISFVVMQRRGILHALAHDHHFEQAGFEALLRREPPR